MPRMGIVRLDSERVGTIVEIEVGTRFTYDAAWLERSGFRDDACFHDLFVAALHAVPRARDKGELVRPEARALEGLRVTLFDDVPAPPGPDAELVEQGELSLG